MMVAGKVYVPVCALLCCAVSRLLLQRADELMLCVCVFLVF